MNALDEALKLATLGYAVFPCAAGQKRPATTNGLLDASADVDIVQKMFAAAGANCNLALRTDSLLVVDIDGADNHWLVDQPDRLAELSTGPFQKTPKGKHFIFRAPDGRRFRNTASKLAPGVDTRADGGYILLAPSQVDGKSYQWVNAIDCEPEGLPEPPAWLIEILDAVSRPAARANVSIAAAGDSARVFPIGERNCGLTSLGGGLRRINMSHAEILAALLVANRERCKPPLDDAEVEVIAKSVARYEPDQIATLGIESPIDFSGEDDFRATNPGEAIPAKLLRPPGFIASVVDFTLATAPHPEPVLALAGALALQSFMGSRKVADPLDNRSSLYIVALAHTGTGKDYPRKVCSRALNEVGLGDCVGNSLASAEGLEDALFLQPSFLLLADEVDFLFSAIKAKRDTRYENIAKVLLEFYTSAAEVYSLRIKAARDGQKKERQQIDQPGLTICGSAIPGRLYESLSPALLTNGLFSRLLIFEAGRRHPGQDVPKRELPEDILAPARFWADYVPSSERNLATIHPSPRLVEQTAEALEILQDFRAGASSKIDAAHKHGDECTMAIYTRAHEKARRLALNYACSADYMNPIIGADAATWACDLVVYLTERMLFMADTNVSENEFDAKCQKAVRVIGKWSEQNPDGWMPGWLLKRRIKGWTPQDHDSVRRILIENGTIERGLIEPKTGRPGEAFRLRNSSAVAGCN